MLPLYLSFILSLIWYVTQVDYLSWNFAENLKVIEQYEYKIYLRGVNLTSGKWTTGIFEFFFYI